MPVNPLTQSEAQTLADAANTEGGLSVTASDMQAWASRQGTSGTPSDLDLLKLMAARIKALGG